MSPEWRQRSSCAAPPASWRRRRTCSSPRGTTRRRSRPSASAQRANALTVLGVKLFEGRGDAVLVVAGDDVRRGGEHVRVRVGWCAGGACPGKQGQVVGL